MRVFNGVKQIQPLAGSALTLGNFDGLHLGHRELISRLKAFGGKLSMPTGVFTFDPHPIRVLYPDRGFLPLFDRDDLEAELAKLGLDYLVIEEFNSEIAQLPPDRFVEDYLVKFLRPQRMVIGHDFVFGNQRSGSIENLLRLGEKNGFNVTAVDPVCVENEVISSSEIRRALANGNVKKAQLFLGRPFYTKGEVIRGAGRGAGLGFATANILPSQTVVPKSGVYVTRVKVGSEFFPSVTNIGSAPTFQVGSSQGIRVESHILDQKIDLYGSVIEVHFLSYIREEQKFASVALLTDQIQNDVQAARHFFATNKL